MKLATPALKRSLLAQMAEYDSNYCSVNEWCADMRDVFEDVTSETEVHMLDVLDAYEEADGDDAAFVGKAMPAIGVLAAMLCLKRAMVQVAAEHAAAAK
jgi:flagellar motor component MotA